ETRRPSTERCDSYSRGALATCTSRTTCRMTRSAPRSSARECCMDPPEEQEDEPDVLPDLGNQVMALLWVLLFAGRWLIGQYLVSSGTISAEQMAIWDEGPLLRCYLVLLAVTL